MELEQAIRGRRSLKSYDPAHEITDEDLARIFELVTLSPSSFNLQHWRFVVVRSEEGRKRLQQAAYGQPHVGENSAVVAICAKLAAHEDAARCNGHAPPEVLEKLVPVIETSYADTPQFQRDEAIRSASLAAMTLMLVAQEHGLASCPMIGFDPTKVADAVALPDGHIVVMLVVLGKPGPVAPFPTSRLPLDEVVHVERFR